MTEIADLYDPLASERESADEARRILDAVKVSERYAQRAKLLAEEQERREQAKRLAEEGLSMIAGTIGASAVESTLDLVQKRHSNGHNKTLPNYTENL